MDELITDLEELTQELMLQLEEVDSDELERFVNKRQFIIDSMLGQENRQATLPQQARLQKIMEYDHAILIRMNSLKIEAKDWLIQRNQAKVQKNAYEASYAVDSIIVDTKRY
ncbi:hypothetical protein C161_00445 [Paenibacillus sp. FSL R5-192]|uniref:hypothetical protein n=1 Tax=Paenibacillus sp. FSL R5-192 TaxID=1226754 RepID=UPI0003E2BBC6|nr:hypothetical protein [Paenibacillus sp. FSL R5-192]ETT41080.1 hypothetical protein C161_00445 [Paenibacillus sp. FSL R5-192]